LNLFEFPFLADENVHPEVVAHMHNQGMRVLTIAEAGLISQPDTAVRKHKTVRTRVRKL
jgi:hypothetical protein